MKKISQDTRFFLCFKRINLFYTFLTLVILVVIIGGILLVSNSRNKILSGLPYLFYILIFITLIQAFETYYNQGDKIKLKLVLFIYSCLFLFNALPLVYYLLENHNQNDILLMYLTIIINVFGLINHIFGVLLLYSYLRNIKISKRINSDSIFL